MHAKIGTLNLQKKAVSKLADLVRVHKNKCTPMLTKRSAHATWLVSDPRLADCYLKETGKLVNKQLKMNNFGPCKHHFV